MARHNLQTGESVTYLRSDPPLFWRRCEGVAAALTVAGGIAAFATVGGVVPPGVIAATLIRAPATMLARGLRRKLRQQATDLALPEAIWQAKAQTFPPLGWRRVNWGPVPRALHPMLGSPAVTKASTPRLQPKRSGPPRTRALASFRVGSTRGSRLGHARCFCSKLALR